MCFLLILSGRYEKAPEFVVLRYNPFSIIIPLPADLSRALPRISETNSGSSLSNSPFLNAAKLSAKYSDLLAVAYPEILPAYSLMREPMELLVLASNASRCKWCPMLPAPVYCMLQALPDF